MIQPKKFLTSFQNSFSKIDKNTFKQQKNKTQREGDEKLSTKTKLSQVQHDNQKKPCNILMFDVGIS